MSLRFFALEEENEPTGPSSVGLMCFCLNAARRGRSYGPVSAPIDDPALSITGPHRPQDDSSSLGRFHRLSPSRPSSTSGASSQKKKKKARAEQPRHPERAERSYRRIRAPVGAQCRMACGRRIRRRAPAAPAGWWHGVPVKTKPRVKLDSADASLLFRPIRIPAPRDRSISTLLVFSPFASALLRITARRHPSCQVSCSPAMLFSSHLPKPASDKLCPNALVNHYCSMFIAGFACVCRL